MDDSAFNIFNAGDLIVAIRSHGGMYSKGDFTKGKLYVVKEAFGNSVFTELDDKGSTTNGWHKDNWKRIPEECRVLAGLLYG